MNVVWSSRVCVNTHVACKWDEHAGRCGDVDVKSKPLLTSSPKSCVTDTGVTEANVLNNVPPLEPGMLPHSASRTAPGLLRRGVRLLNTLPAVAAVDHEKDEDEWVKVPNDWVRIDFQGVLS